MSLIRIVAFFDTKLCSLKDTYQDSGGTYFFCVLERNIKLGSITYQKTIIICTAARMSYLLFSEFKKFDFFGSLIQRFCVFIMIIWWLSLVTWGFCFMWECYCFFTVKEQTNISISGTIQALLFFAIFALIKAASYFIVFHVAGNA
jgi:hypothetical protein